MSEFNDPKFGQMNSQKLSLTYLDKLHQFQQHQPQLMPYNAEELMDLNYHGELDGDALLNMDQVTQSNLGDMRPMSDWSQQLAHPAPGELDESLMSQPLALAAYKVATDSKLPEKDQQNLLVATSQYLDPDDDFKDDPTKTLKQQYGFDDETVLTAQDLANDVDQECRNYQDLLFQQFDQSGFEIRTQNPTIGETEKTKKLKADFLNQYCQGLNDELANKQNDVNYEIHVQDIAADNVDLNQQSYGYMLGQMTSQQLLHQLDDFEDQKYRQRVNSRPLSAEEVNDLLTNTTANDVRDNSKLRIMSDTDYQVMQHATLNYAFNNLKDALIHLDDQDVTDAQQPENVNVTNVASVMQDVDLKQLTFADHNLLGGMLSESDRQPSYKMRDAYRAKFSSDTYPSDLKDLVNDFAHRNYEAVVNNDLISVQDKARLKQEHSVWLDKDIARFMDEPGESKQDSLLTGVNLNATIDEPDKLESLQVSPKQAKEETTEQQLQHDEDSHKENVTVVKSKKRSKLKANDGPEM